MATTKNPTIGRAKIWELAGKSGCDPRTVARALRGMFVRGLAGDRVRSTLEAEGLLPEPPRGRAA
jgi:hypothetical protein